MGLISGGALRTEPRVATSDPEGLLRLFSAEAPPVLCTHAQRFCDWAGELCAKAMEKKTVTAIDEAKVLVANRFMMWRKNVPFEHQSDDEAFAGGGHACILSVFEWAYQRLLDAELDLASARLDALGEVSATYRVRPTPFDGIFGGEISLSPDEFD
jgi:hypothetical protein